MAASSFISLTPIRTSPPPRLHLQPKAPFSIKKMKMRMKMRMMKKRGDLLVSNAVPPSSTSLILAFILPLSLFAGTVFASIRIADDLDEKFLEDLAVNKALMEEKDEEEEDGEIGVLIDGSRSRVMEVEGEEEIAVPAAAPRTRNRPRRQG